MNRTHARYKRISGIRDPRLVIIASEGEKTEPQYFEELVSHDYFYNPRVQVEVLRRMDHDSSPKYVLRELNKYKQKFNLTKDDELWIVIDFDRWTNRELNLVAAECHKRGYHMALSNPCFELWLLLHLSDVTTYSSSSLTSVCCTKASLKNKLKELVRSFKGHDDLNLSIFLTKVRQAINNSKKLDKNPQDRWPTSIGTRVYMLVETIIP